jgi:hypothetical protein
MRLRFGRAIRAPVSRARQLSPRRRVRKLPSPHGFLSCTPGSGARLPLEPQASGRILCIDQVRAETAIYMQHIEYSGLFM